MSSKDLEQLLQHCLLFKFNKPVAQTFDKPVGFVAEDTWDLIAFAAGHITGKVNVKSTKPK